MNKTFISKTTRLAERVELARKRYSDLDEKFGDLKRECDHCTPDGKMTLKTVRVPKRGSQRAYTFKACAICGEDIYKDVYGRYISVWNHLEIPEACRLKLEKIMGNS